MSQKQTKIDAFAEIIESSLDSFLAQSWEWDRFPNFSSLLKVEHSDYTVLGTVTHIQTGSMDPMRYPFPYQKTEAELKEEHPQIFEFLKTTFRVHVLGYINHNDSLLYMLPPKPCKIHSFVSNCTKIETERFFSNTDFLHLLFAFQQNINNLDELLLAILRQLEEHKLLTREKLHEFSNTFSLLTGNDYRRLKLFLSRAQNIVNYK